MSCDHDSRFKGVFFLPKADGGCTACALEHVTAEYNGMVHQRNSYRHELQGYNPKLCAELDANYEPDPGKRPEQGDMIGVPDFMKRPADSRRDCDVYACPHKKDCPVHSGGDCDCGDAADSNQCTCGGIEGDDPKWCDYCLEKMRLK